jgi:two-component system sensor histidine kinase YesM
MLEKKKEKKTKPKLIVSTVFSLGTLVLLPTIIILIILSTQVKDQLIDQNIVLETESIQLMSHNIEREIMYNTTTDQSIFTDEELISLEVMEQFYKSTYKDSKNTILLVNDKNKIIASNREGLINSIYNKPTASKNEIIIIQDIGKTKWELVKLINTKTITHNIDRVFIAVYISLLFLFSIYLSYSLFILVLIRIPVKQLLQSMEKIGSGTYKEKEYATYFDEFESLASEFNQMNDKLAELNNDIESSYKNKLASEIEALRFQINPMFMCNTLEMIKRIAKVEQNNETKLLSDALLTITKDNLTNKGSLIEVEKEIINIEAYLYIMRVRYEDNITLIKDIDESILKQRIPTLLIQPLIENSIKHGLIGLEKKGIISLSIKKKGDRLIIILRDNGKGVDKVRLTKLLDKDKNYKPIKLPNKVGLINIKKRLDILYPSNSSITFNSIQNGENSFFEQTIIIPLYDDKNI